MQFNHACRYSTDCATGYEELKNELKVIRSQLARLTNGTFAVGNFQLEYYPMQCDELRIFGDIPSGFYKLYDGREFQHEFCRFP